MQLDSLIDWIKLLFISCHARSKHFSTVWGFCSFCLARLLSVLLESRMVDGIEKEIAVPENGWRKCHRQGILKWRWPMWRKQMNFTVCGHRRQGWGEVVYWKVPEQAWWSGEWRICIQPTRGGRDRFFWRIDPVECWASSSVPGNKTPENKIWGFTENHSPPASHKTDQSHQECSPWFQWALERSEVSRCTIPGCETSCRKSESSATAEGTATSQPSPEPGFWWRLSQGDAKSLFPLHPLPPALSPARIWIKPWRELSVRDDFPVIIAWVRDYALFFCKLPYLQSRTHWAHVQLIHSSSNSRSNYRVRCKFNYSTCRKQKQNLIVKFVLLRRKDKKQKKMLKWPVWAEYISLPRAGEKWTLFLLQKPHWIEFSFFFFFPFLFPIQNYDVLLKLLICMCMCNSFPFSRECFGTTPLPFESGLPGWEPSELDLTRWDI